jgi:AraC-like DNA-binding protein
LGVCPRQASRIIKRNYGLTLAQLMEKKRLGIAKELLTATEMSISEIVEYVNFSSVSFFYCRFKKIYGITPAEYRKKHLE